MSPPSMDPLFKEWLIKITLEVTACMCGFGGFLLAGYLNDLTPFIIGCILLVMIGAASTRVMVPGPAQPPPPSTEVPLSRAGSPDTWQL